MIEVKLTLLFKGNRDQQTVLGDISTIQNAMQLPFGSVTVQPDGNFFHDLEGRDWQQVTIVIEVSEEDILGWFINNSPIKLAYVLHDGWFRPPEIPL